MATLMKWKGCGRKHSSTFQCFLRTGEGGGEDGGWWGRDAGGMREGK